MNDKKMWMVRSDSGRLYEDFKERNVVAVGWWALAGLPENATRKQFIEIYASKRPDLSAPKIRAGASQVWRFLHEIAEGDWVITYNPSTRNYLIGQVIAGIRQNPSDKDSGLAIQRQVKWLGEVSRDRLGVGTKNTLGSTLSLFRLSDESAKEIMSVLENPEIVNSVPVETEEAETQAAELKDIEARALEFIKDKITTLDWDEMQELVAGLLRAMGYKTQISPSGPDRGKDIIASPDGFGFENPRIVVEVKHRTGAMGSQAVRSFLGGRHKDDKGLYVSTGGFTKDAYYEAERASIPLTLMDLDDLVRALVEYYEKADVETQRLVPLKRVYWPT